MRAPQIVDSPTLFPNRCFGCGSITGPLIDTMVDRAKEGRAYLCVTNCLLPMSSLAGCLVPEERVEVEERLDEAVARVAELEVALEAERDPAAKVVRLEDLQELFAALTNDLMPAEEPIAEPEPATSSKS